MSAVFFGGCMQTEQGRAATQNSSYSIFEVVFKCLRAVVVNGRAQKRSLLSFWSYTLTFPSSSILTTS